jgi:catechol 2,3-dioxygenase-like lactoylglutathione lyase family enzyme
VTSSPVPRLAAVSLDCADPQTLADFYVALLGGRQLWAKEASAGLEVSGIVLVMQLVEGYVPPVWPGSAVVHLDLTADDIQAAAERAVALGATWPEQPDPRWRVLLDPAGHPFCLTPFTPEAVPANPT